MSYELDKESKGRFSWNWLWLALLLCLGSSPAFAQSVTLTWNASTDTNAVGYKIYCGVASGVYTNTVNVGMSTTATISGLAAGVTYYFSATTVSSSGAESPFSNEATFVPVANTNTSTSTTLSPYGQPPTLNPIANVTISQNAGSQTINLAGISAGTSGSTTVNVYASSSDNGTLISTPTVAYSNPNTTGTLTFTPVSGATGTATVTVTVDNGGANNNPISQTFTVTVQPVAVVVTSTGPSVNPISNVTVYQNSGVQTVQLSGITSDVGQIWAYTSDSTIIPAPTVNFSSPSSTGSLTFTPVAGALGSATITVKVNNGVANFTQSFTVSVVSAPPPPSIPTTPPTLNAITNVTVYQNAGLQTVNLTGITAGTGANPTVNIYATSSDNGTIISVPTIDYTNSSAAGTLSFAPVSSATGTATVTVIVDNGGASNNLVSQIFTVTVLPVVVAVTNQSPTLDPISNVTIYQNSGVQTVSLTGITGGGSSATVVQVWAYTSDSTIIPAPTVNYSNPNSTGSLTFAPVTGALGTATITVTVNNGSSNFNQVFTVTVVPAPVTSPAPTLNAITNVTIYQNAGLQTIALAGITSGSTNQTQPLTVSAASSNPAILPAPSVNYTSPNNVGTLTLLPVTNALGSVTITITVNNGAAYNNTFSRTFTVTVVARPAGSQPPTINPIPNVNVVEASAAQNIPITGITPGTPPTTTATVQSHASAAASSQIRITVTSSNSRLVSPSIRYSNPSSTAVLTLRPGSSGAGTAVITVTVNNGAKTNNITRQSFTVTVLPLQPPTLDPVGNITVTENSGVQTIVLTGVTPGTTSSANQVVRITATSNNPRVISQPQIQYKNPANTALLTFKPSVNFAGKATVTVTVNNGNRINGTLRQTFTVTVVPPSTNSVSTPEVVVAPVETPDIAPVQDVAATLTTIPQPAGQFAFQVTGIPGGQYVVQATTDLTHWTSVQTNTAPFVFQDTTSGADKQFYRAYYVQKN